MDGSVDLEPITGSCLNFCCLVCGCKLHMGREPLRGAWFKKSAIAAYLRGPCQLGSVVQAKLVLAFVGFWGSAGRTLVTGMESAGLSKPLCHQLLPASSDALEESSEKLFTEACIKEQC
jgi:hypothetical protein